MKAAEAKEILKCSYTTLHNYVKLGKLKLSEKTGKQQDYDENSVMDLYHKLNKRYGFSNSIHIFTETDCYQFKLSSKLVDIILHDIKHQIGTI